MVRPVRCFYEPVLCSLAFNIRDVLKELQHVDTISAPTLCRTVDEAYGHSNSVITDSVSLTLRETYIGVFRFRRIPIRQIPFRRMPCKLFFPSFSFQIPFINAIQPFYGCQRNAHKKYYRYCVG